MTISPSRRLISAEDYHRMREAGILTEEDRVELIRGEIFEMSPIGSRHAACVNRIIALFFTKINGKAIISSQNPISINQVSEPEPDIALLKPASDFYAHQLPTPADTLLIIEVADASLQYDREVKLPLYAGAGIPEYWIVNLPAREVEVHRSPMGDRYQFREIALPDDELTVFGEVFKVKDLIG